MSAKAKCDSVLMVGFGGPTRPDEVRPFLDNVLRGRPVPRERYEAVVHHYELLGGKSPYNELTMRQADALRIELARKNTNVPVAVGMRNWNPYVADSMRALAKNGARRVLAFILAAHRCEASWERYQQTVHDAQTNTGESEIEVVYPEPWHDHPLFIKAVASRTREALASSRRQCAVARDSHLHRAQYSGRDGRGESVRRATYRVGTDGCVRSRR